MIILCGPSATGKTEIAKLLNEKFHISKAITTTTRPIRVNETNDVDYHFITKDRFLELLKEEYFIEHVEYNSNFYGCGKNEVKDDRVVVLEPEGVNNFLKMNNPHIIVFVLNASEETRIKRMEHRQDKPEDIQRRIKEDRIHFSKDKLNFANFIIETDNKTLDEIADEIHSLYKNKLNSIA